MRKATVDAWAAVVEDATSTVKPPNAKTVCEFARFSGLGRYAAKRELDRLTAAGKVKAVQCRGKGGLITVYLPAG